MRVVVTGAKSMFRNSDGTFTRLRQQFSLDNFDDGYVDNKGRFRVWMPNHPRAYLGGYILRAIVAYELYNKVNVPADMDIHHKDGNCLNDSKENLIMIKHKTHSSLTNSKPFEAKFARRICKWCKNPFHIEKYRLRSKDWKRGQFCSQVCYHRYRRL